MRCCSMIYFFLNNSEVDSRFLCADFIHRSSWNKVVFFIIEYCFLLFLHDPHDVWQCRGTTAQLFLWILLKLVVNRRSVRDGICSKILDTRSKKICFIMYICTSESCIADRKCKVPRLDGTPCKEKNWLTFTWSACNKKWMHIIEYTVRPRNRVGKFIK